MNPVAPALAALTLVVTPVLAPVASAERTDGSKCHGEMDLRVVPGLGLKPNRGNAFVRNGTITCEGSVQGKALTGPGKISGSVRYGTAHPDSCTTGGEGTGVIRLDLPTDTGTLTVKNPISYTFSAIGKGGLLAGEFTGSYFSATYSTMPTKGDCVTSPVTAAKLTFTGAMHDLQPPQ